jgi:hypothetical protein
MTMAISLEKIDMLMERANISYKEAKDALEKFDGDMVEALIFLESNEKVSAGRPSSRSQENRERREKRQQRRGKERDFFEDLKKMFKKMHATSFIIAKKGKRLLDIPLTIAVFIILFTLPASLFLLILPYVFGYQIAILNADGTKANFNDSFEKENTQTTDEDEREERYK